MTSSTDVRDQFTTARSIPQKVCIALGVGFVLIGLIGIVMPGFMGMHLSMSHNLIHLISGGAALWVGYADDPRKAYYFSVAFGFVYGLLGVGGFLLGQPGYPGVGHMEADQNLLRVIPNVLELGSNDHMVHLLLSGLFLFSAFVHKRRYQEADRSIVDVQRRRDTLASGTTRTIDPDISFRNDRPNSESDLPHVDLGVSDVNRTADMNRRADFEKRI